MNSTEWKKAVPPAILGSLCTLLLAALFGWLSSLSGCVIEEASKRVGYITLSKLQITSREGHQDGVNNWIASCEPDEKVIGGYCQIGSGTGSLFDAGVIPSSGQYQCAWNNKDSKDPFTAHVFALCLH